LCSSHVLVPLSYNWYVHVWKKICLFVMYLQNLAFCLMFVSRWSSFHEYKYSALDNSFFNFIGTPSAIGLTCKNTLLIDYIMILFGYMINLTQIVCKTRLLMVIKAHLQLHITFLFMVQGICRHDKSIYLHQHFFPAFQEYTLAVSLMVYHVRFQFICLWALP